MINDRAVNLLVPFSWEEEKTIVVVLIPFQESPPCFQDVFESMYWGGLCVFLYLLLGPVPSSIPVSTTLVVLLQPCFPSTLFSTGLLDHGYGLEVCLDLIIPLCWIIMELTRVLEWCEIKKQFRTIFVQVSLVMNQYNATYAEWVDLIQYEKTLINLSYLLLSKFGKLGHDVPKPFLSVAEEIGTIS